MNLNLRKFKISNHKKIVRCWLFKKIDEAYSRDFISSLEFGN